MEENKLIKETEKTFESIRHIDENGVEFWYARELMETLGCRKWGNFKKVIIKAIALSQTYFAVQTRKQELTEEEYKRLSEDEKRLYNRKYF